MMMVTGVVALVSTYVEERLPGPGAGLVVTGKLWAADVPPPGVGFTAVNDKVPVEATSAEVSTALTCVLLMNVVTRAVPLT